MPVGRVSVIIPCYKQAEFLPAALESVLAQHGVEMETIVVDDGSPDDVARVCRRFGPAVTYVHQENAGLSAARNAGIERASGEYLHFLDADDMIAPGMYESMLESLHAHPEWAAVVCGTVCATADGSPTEMILEPPQAGNHFQALALRNLFPVGAVVLRRDLLAHTGCFDTSLSGAADWDLWVRVARSGAVFGSIADPYFVYRIRPAGMGNQALHMFADLKEVCIRAHQADSRVAEPAPECADGADPVELNEALAVIAASNLGKAIGGGDSDSAIELLAELSRLTAGQQWPKAYQQCIYHEAAMACGILPPARLPTLLTCLRAIEEMIQKTCSDPYAASRATDILMFISGCTELEEDRNRWKENYRRLARTFPVSLMLWLRRRVLGIPAPSNDTQDGTPREM